MRWSTWKQKLLPMRFSTAAVLELCRQAVFVQSLSLYQLDLDSLRKTSQPILRHLQRHFSFIAANNGESVQRVDDSHLCFHDGKPHPNAASGTRSKRDVGHGMTSSLSLLRKSEQMWRTWTVNGPICIFRNFFFFCESDTTTCVWCGSGVQPNKATDGLRYLSAEVRRSRVPRANTEEVLPFRHKIFHRFRSPQFGVSVNFVHVHENLGSFWNTIATHVRVLRACSGGRPFREKEMPLVLSILPVANDSYICSFSVNSGSLNNLKNWHVWKINRILHSTNGS